MREEGEDWDFPGTFYFLKINISLLLKLVHSADLLWWIGFLGSLDWKTFPLYASTNLNHVCIIAGLDGF